MGYGTSRLSLALLAFLGSFLHSLESVGEGREREHEGQRERERWLESWFRSLSRAGFLGGHVDGYRLQQMESLWVCWSYWEMGAGPTGVCCRCYKTSMKDNYTTTTTTSGCALAAPSVPEVTGSQTRWRETSTHGEYVDIDADSSTTLFLTSLPFFHLPRRRLCEVENATTRVPASTRRASPHADARQI